MARRDDTATTGDALTRADRTALSTLTEVVRDARERGGDQPAFVLIAGCLADLGVALPERANRPVVLKRARDDWLRRVETARRSPSTVSAYRVALDDLLDFLEHDGREERALTEETLVAYLTNYRQRMKPAEATYYRRFTLLRNFFRWVSRHGGVPDPFVDLEPPAKPQQEADWLTAEEFARLLEAAGRPQRRRAGLAERDRLVLLTLVATGLRRSELLALDWGNLELDSERPSLLVRRGKGGKPRRQPLPAVLADEFARRRATFQPGAETPVFCGLAGKRLTSTILATIIRRAAERAGLEKRVSAHALRHTAATWLRQQTGDARLVAAYLGHADLSTVSRYAHVAAEELHSAAEAIALSAALDMAFRARAPAEAHARSVRTRATGLTGVGAAPSPSESPGRSGGRRSLGQRSRRG
jgi:site-specific recombinase XerD